MADSAWLPWLPWLTWLTHLADMADTAHTTAPPPARQLALHNCARLFRTRDRRPTSHKSLLLGLSPLQANRVTPSGWQPAIQQPRRRRQVCAQGRLQAEARHRRHALSLRSRSVASPGASQPCSTRACLTRPFGDGSVAYLACKACPLAGACDEVFNFAMFNFGQRPCD